MHPHSPTCKVPWLGQFPHIMALAYVCRWRTAAQLHRRVGSLLAVPRVMQPPGALVPSMFPAHCSVGLGTSPQGETPPTPPTAPAVASQQHKKAEADSSRTVLMAMTGNSLILVLKAIVYLRTGSSAMLAETVHTLADTLNQALLWMGVRQSQAAPDTRHPYGYGKAAYFWSLVSALGLFWCGAGVSVFHGLLTLAQPTHIQATMDMWAVLAGSLAVDGYVLARALRVVLQRAHDRSVEASDPTHSDHEAAGRGGVPLGQAQRWWRVPMAFSFAPSAPISSSLGMLRAAYWYVRKARDPFVTAVFLQDAVACSGVLLAGAGVGLSHLTGSPIWDSLASIAIGGMLGGVAVQMVRLNHRYLLGHAVQSSTLAGIRSIILSLPSIDAVGDVQSQYVGPNAFTYKAQVDFDGTYLSARLQKAYLGLFTQAAERGSLEADLPLLLSLYAEDVTRLVERELKEVENRIRQAYPGAVYIELEPDSKESERPMHSMLQDASARAKEERALWQQLTGVLAVRAARKPHDPDIVSEQARLNEWFHSIETRGQSRDQLAAQFAARLVASTPPSADAVQGTAGKGDARKEAARSTAGSTTAVQGHSTEGAQLQQARSDLLSQGDPVEDALEWGTPQKK